MVVVDEGLLDRAADAFGVGVLLTTQQRDIHILGAYFVMTPFPPSATLFLEVLIRHARDRGCFLELDSQPDRLDLLDTWCRVAKEEGVLVAIDSDAHSVHDFDDLEWGIGQARRGWLTADDVLNTRSLEALRPLLARTMGKAS